MTEIPEYITRQQITEAFAAMGLDASEITRWSGDARDRFMTVEMRPKDAHRNVEVVIAKIPFGVTPPSAD